MRNTGHIINIDYLNDTGLLCFLLSIDASSLINGPLIGPVGETFIFAEFRKKMMLGSSSSIWFYRDANGREIDFLQIKEGKIDLFEAKWTESPDSRWRDSLKDVASILQKSKTYSVGDLTVLCRSQNEFKKDSVSIMHAADYFRRSSTSGLKI